MKRDYTKLDFIKAIKNSGYLFESEIAQLLTARDFFVETNSIIIDPKTGKDREIDIVAEYFDKKNQTLNFEFISLFKFVFELKNNDYPLILMTKLEPTPNTILYECLKEARTFKVDAKIYDDPQIYLDFIFNLDSNIYTQYCSFKEKKNKANDLMAFHPDTLNAGFSKITQYCDEQIESWESNESNYNRYVLYLPILLIKNDIYELGFDKNSDPTLRKVNRSKFVYNYHKNGFHKSSVIFIINEKGLEPFLSEMLEFSKRMEAEVSKQYSEKKTKRLI